jgi:tetrapyrrole methylase family protein/MazG family protein
MSWFSLVERTLVILDVTVQDLQLANAGALAARRYPNLSPDRPALIGPLGGRAQCERLSLLLRNAYPADHEVTVVTGLDGEQPAVRSLYLQDLLTAPVEGISALYVAPLPCPGAVETFQATIAHLRAPDGCPWDREQTHQSLRKGFLEECYEVLEALDRGDLELLVEELGDVLLHILLQAQIASEQGEFTMSDIVCYVHNKIVYRHPHVFDGLAVDSVDKVLTNWEELKLREKGDRAQASSLFEGIPVSMPALARTQAMLRRARRLGVSPVRDEALERIGQAVTGLNAETTPTDRAKVLGDLLFDLASLSSTWGLDAETMLREANNRFESMLTSA